MTNLKKVTAAFLLLTMVFCFSSCRRNVGDFIKRDSDKTEKKENTENVFDGGGLKLASTVTDTFNPLLTSSYTLRRTMEMVYEPLYSVDGEYKPYEVLAKSASAAADGMSIEIKLKSGIVWHDNSAFGADDVVYTVKNIIAGSANVKRPAISDIVKTSGDSVKIIFSRPVINARSMLDFPIVKSGTPFSADISYIPVGTGKYRYGGKVSVDSYKFEPFNMYHGQAASEGFELTAVDSWEKELQMFKSGETDVFFADDNQTISAANGKTKTIDEPSDKLVYLGINFKNPLFSGKNTRNALEKIIDKNAVAGNMQIRKAVPADYAVNPKSWICKALDDKGGYNLDEAERLIKLDGWSAEGNRHFVRDENGSKTEFIIRILTNQNELHIKAAEYISGELMSFGIDCSVQSCGEEEYEALINAGYYDLFIGEKSLGSNMDFYELAASPNVFSYVNASLEENIRMLASENDGAAADELYKRCIEFIKSDTPFIPLYFKNRTIFYSEAFG